MGNLLSLGKQYEAYVTVLQGEGGGTLIYIDAQGHIHVVPTGPDSRRIADELAPEIAALQQNPGAIATKMQRIGAPAGVGA